jgi:hypothetical protein
MEFAKLITEKFGPKMVDPGQFVAMGGMPADDEEVVFVGETTKAEEDKKMHEKDYSAYKKVNDANNAMRQQGRETDVEHAHFK